MNKHTPIFKSLELIESRITEKLTVGHIASAVYFSKFHYSRLFREIVGETVMEYVTKRRMTLAGKALLETDAPIIDVAVNYGYDSREGFTRSFKAYMGISPSEYRKYGLAAISHNIVKGSKVMSYSKTTDEIVRDLNHFIAQARAWADSARAKKHNNTFQETVWNSFAEDTDAMADRVEKVIRRVSSIADNPDEITSRFALVKIVDDVAFETNIRTLNMYLCVIGREPEEHHAENMPYCEKYRYLAHLGAEASKKMNTFLNELAALIFDDMRKTAEEKIKYAIQKGKEANESIENYAIYIKNELGHLIEKLSNIQMEELTAELLEMCMFQLKILRIASKVDVFRWPDSKPMFDGMDVFMDALVDAEDLCRTIVKPPSPPSPDDIKLRVLQNIAFQTNILLFFTRSELEKLGILLETGSFLSDEQKTAFNLIEGKMNAVISTALNATEDSVFVEMADKVYEVVGLMETEAEKLGVRGGCIKIINGEYKNLADKINHCITDLAALRQQQ